MEADENGACLEKQLCGVVAKRNRIITQISGCFIIPLVLHNLSVYGFLEGAILKLEGGIIIREIAQLS